MYIVPLNTNRDRVTHRERSKTHRNKLTSMGKMLPLLSGQRDHKRAGTSFVLTGSLPQTSYNMISVVLES